MNKKWLFPLVLFSLGLTGCNQGAKALATPELSVNSDGTGLSWTEVADATGYELKVNGTELGLVTSYSFDSRVGNYSVSVRAVCDDAKRASAYSTEFQYSTVESSIGSLSFNNEVISWTGLEGAGVEVSKDGGDYVTVSGTSYQPTGLGIYTFRAKAGWSDADHKFYVVGSKASKSIYVCPKAISELILEDGSASSNAELQETYTVEKYSDGSGWVASTATVALNSEANAGATDGKCVVFNYFRHGAYFKFSKPVVMVESRNALEFDVKGDGFSKMVVAFQVMDDLTINGLSMKGIYVKYVIDTVEAKWQHYVLPFSDSGWLINYSGNDMTFASVQSVLGAYGYSFESLADLLTLTNEFQIRLTATPDENWSSTKMYGDNFKLVNTDEKTAKIDDIVVLSPKYTLVGGSAMYDLFLENGIATVGTLASGTYVKENDLLKVTITEPAAGEIVMKTVDGGSSFDFVSSSGVCATLGEVKMIPYVYMIDNFEGYSATGTGYDKNNQNPASATGMRAHYYSDYYSGGNTTPSPIGGNNWELMGSTDYLDLATSTGHSGSKSAKFKYNPQAAMRMISGDICLNENAAAIGKGEIFSFWVKGGTKYNFELKVRVFYSSARLTPSTQQTNNTYVEGIKVQANSEWTQVKINLDASKTYYGFSITTVANWGSNGADYFYVDDISIYGSIDPWSIN